MTAERHLPSLRRLLACLYIISNGPLSEVSRVHSVCKQCVTAPLMSHLYELDELAGRQLQAMAVHLSVQRKRLLPALHAGALGQHLKPGAAHCSALLTWHVACRGHSPDYLDTPHHRGASGMILCPLDSVICVRAEVDEALLCYVARPGTPSRPSCTRDSTGGWLH